MAQHLWEQFSPEELSAVHRASMTLLTSTGVNFCDDSALAYFRHHGVKVSGHTVYLRESEVLAALAQAPSSFTLHAREAYATVTVGAGRPCFAPGYGAPFMMDAGARRLATMADYDRLARLADALPNQDLSGHLLVQPADVAPDVAHLHMLFSHMTNSSKPFMGSAFGRRGARHTMEMASILLDASALALAERPVTIALINTTSPLQYDPEAASALVEYARWRQPVLISALIMAGATGPITLAGVLAQQNAELLAGVTLAQLISPGTPVVYGSFSTLMDMRTGMLALGSPESTLLAAGAAQLARSYGLPCRIGGAVTDGHALDMQAGAETMTGLMTAVLCGADFVLQAGGLLSSTLAFSLEKFVVDDELCGMARRLNVGVPVTDVTLATDVIASVGKGGNFLEEDHTLEHCRAASGPQLFWQRQEYEQWRSNGSVPLSDQAESRWQNLLFNQRPDPLDPATDRQLKAYVSKHSG